MAIFVMDNRKVDLNTALIKLFSIHVTIVILN